MNFGSALEAMTGSGPFGAGASPTAPGGRSSVRLPPNFSRSEIDTTELKIRVLRVPPVLQVLRVRFFLVPVLRVPVLQFVVLWVRGPAGFNRAGRAAECGPGQP